MKNRLLFFVLLFTLSLLFAGPARGQHSLGRETRVDSVLASVNGEPITLLDVILETGSAEVKLAGIFSGERLFSETEKLRKSVIEEIIIRKLIFAKYKANPFKIEKQYVENILDNMAAGIGDGTRETLERKAAEMGSTMDDLRARAKEKIAVDIMLSEFCDRQVYVTPKEVYDEYVKNSDRWTIPSSTELQLLQILKEGARSGNKPEETCKKIVPLLSDMQKDPAVFERAIKDYSDSSGNPVSATKLRPEFEEALKDAKPGMVVGPVVTPEAFYFIRVVRHESAKVRPFEEVSAAIKQSINQTAISNRRADFATRLKSKALIRYHY